MKRVVGKKSGKRFSLGAFALIGQGAEGKVYRADSEAIKVLKTPLGPGEVARTAALVSLGRKVAGFAWPTEIVTDPATNENVGIAMRFVPGETLESILDRRGTGSMPVVTKVRLSIAVARAVAEAHVSRGPSIVLGDVIKSGNLVIDGEEATFVDTASASLFGYRDEAGEVRKAISQLTTPGYVPKEVLENPTALPSESADLFAVAVLIFELLFGKAPYDVKPCPESFGLEPDDAVKQGVCPRFKLHPVFEAPTYDPVDVPGEVDQLFRAAFLTPLRPSAIDWCRELEAWLDQVSEPEDEVRPRWKRLPRWPRSTDPLAVAFVAVVVFAYAAKFGWQFFLAFTSDPTPEVRTSPPAPSRPVGPPLFQELFK